MVSSRESPPNLFSTARASTRATIASATTPAAGTAQTSERWWMPVAASPVAMSTVFRARGTVEIGFMAARTLRVSPLVMPPSRPPARLVVRYTPSSSRTISSWASEPRRRASSKPSPISTPLMAWIPMRAAASWASRRSSPEIWEPNPMGSPSTMTSTMPPRVSPDFLAASISVIMEASASLPKDRTGDSSIAVMSAKVGVGPS
ncbi:conserved hypothetical protein [Corynebacterium efficiens YS-314]|uniref:Uncharacterized protein n=1 Tax=Corynebacterium efficiens (strain DSM 44549 / YS-314 / AJ 12310 / JCM 11189 / NBRC 100395) TaxID=196164 RepID=Q8FT28_COREF|nr:conserved hypothetical protein [Corynebacterium efficiens YS-314]